MLGFSGALPWLWGRCPQKGARDRVWVRAGLQSWPGCRGATWGLLRPRPLHLQGAEIWGPAASSCPGLVFCGRRREGTAPSAGFEREAGRGRAPCFGGKEAVPPVCHGQPRTRTGPGADAGRFPVALPLSAAGSGTGILRRSAPAGRSCPGNCAQWKENKREEGREALGTRCQAPAAGDPRSSVLSGWESEATAG